MNMPLKRNEQIYLEWKNGAKKVLLAKKYGITPQAIGSIIKHREYLLSFDLELRECCNNEIHILKNLHWIGIVNLPQLKEYFDLNPPSPRNISDKSWEALKYKVQSLMSSDIK